MQQGPTFDQIFRSAHTLDTQIDQLLDWYDKKVREQSAQIDGLTKKISELDPNLKKPK